MFSEMVSAFASGLSEDRLGFVPPELDGIVLAVEVAPDADGDRDDGRHDEQSDDGPVEQGVRAPQREYARDHRADVVRGVPPADEAAA